MSSSSPSQSPRVISVEDNDSDLCILAESRATSPLVKKKKKSMPVVILWGEVESATEEDDALTLAVIKDIKKKAILGVSEFPAAEEPESVFLMYPKKFALMDEHVLHSIKLQSYVRNMETTIAEVKEGGTEEGKSYPSSPEVPKTSRRIDKRCSFFPNIRMERESTAFSVGRGNPTLNLPINCARAMLAKGVEALLAHHSFTESSEIALNTLVDVADQLLTNLSEKLRVACDQEAMTGDCGFISITERALTEMNLGSLEEILKYYRQRIIGIHDSTERKCHQLSKTYTDLVKTKVNGQTEQIEQVEVNLPVEEEEYEDEEDEEDIPEIHFPALDEDDQLGLQPSLETGFQMLDSLEHDESLQNLDPDEEICVDSPSQEFMLSVISELSNTLDFSKGKKKKKKVVD